VGWWLSRLIARPLGKITIAVNGLAAGDTKIEVPAIKRTDEIGLMAQAVETFKQSLTEKQRLEQEAEATRKAAEEERLKQEAESQYYVEAHNTFMKNFSAALERLSKGDLAYRLDTPFTEDYEKIHHDFNTTAGSLQEAMLRSPPARRPSVLPPTRSPRRPMTNRGARRSKRRALRKQRRPSTRSRPP
jgi:methyl-accepting chemotaxis protein